MRAASSSARVRRRRQPRAASPIPPPKSPTPPRLRRHRKSPRPRATTATPPPEVPTPPRLTARQQDPAPSSPQSRIPILGGRGFDAIGGWASCSARTWVAQERTWARATRVLPPPYIVLPPYKFMAMAIDIPRCLPPALAKFFGDNLLRRRAKVRARRWELLQVGEVNSEGDPHNQVSNGDSCRTSCRS